MYLQIVLAISLLLSGLCLAEPTNPPPHFNISDPKFRHAFVCGVRGVFSSLECDQQLHHLNVSTYTVNEENCCTVFRYNGCLKRQMMKDSDCFEEFLNRTEAIDVAFLENGCRQFHCTSSSGATQNSATAVLSLVAGLVAFLLNKH